MKQMSLTQEQMMIIADSLRSKTLFSIASTNLSMDEVNYTMNDKAENILHEMCDLNLCSYVDHEYILNNDIKLVVDICERSLKRIDLLHKDRINTELVIFVSYDGAAAIEFRPHNKNFEIYFDTKENSHDLLAKKIGLSNALINDERKFSVTIDKCKYYKLIEYYHSSDKKKFAKVCSSIRVKDNILWDFIKNTMDNEFQITLVASEKLKNTQNNYEIYGSESNYLIRTTKEENSMTLVCDDAKGIINILEHTYIEPVEYVIRKFDVRSPKNAFIITCMFILSIFVFLSFVLNVSYVGESGLVLYVVIYTMRAALCISLILVIIWNRKKHLNKIEKALIIVLSVVGSFFIIGDVKAATSALADNKVISCTDYEVEENNNDYILSAKVDGDIQEYYVSNYTYRELYYCTRDIKITLYPYLDIVKDVEIYDADVKYKNSYYTIWVPSNWRNEDSTDESLMFYDRFSSSLFDLAQIFIDIEDFSEYSQIRTIDDYYEIFKDVLVDQQLFQITKAENTTINDHDVRILYADLDNDEGNYKYIMYFYFENNIAYRLIFRTEQTDEKYDTYVQEIKEIFESIEFNENSQ